MDDMPLPALFEQARKIHAAATDSGADQVRYTLLSLFLFLFLFLCSSSDGYALFWGSGGCEEG